jgi:hypothetical protein
MELAPDFSHAASGPLSRQRRRPRGRPKALSFQRQIEIAQAWGEALNAHAVFERDRKRDRAVAKLQARFRTLCAAHAPPHKLAEVTAAIDKLGRITRVPIKPPAMILPIIDRALAQFFGITPRMVRRCRGDSRLRPFMPHPVWLERDWVRAVRLEFEARQVAKRLMTPERASQSRSRSGSLMAASRSHSRSASSGKSFLAPPRSVPAVAFSSRARACPPTGKLGRNEQREHLQSASRLGKGGVISVNEARLRANVVTSK